MRLLTVAHQDMVQEHRKLLAEIQRLREESVQRRQTSQVAAIVSDFSRLNDDGLLRVARMDAPSEAVQRLVAALLELVGERAETWADMAALLASDATRRPLVEFDNNAVTPEQLAVLRPITTDTALSPAALMKESPYAASIASWLHALQNYGRILSRFLPPEYAAVKQRAATLERRIGEAEPAMHRLAQHKRIAPEPPADEAPPPPTEFEGGDLSRARLDTLPDASPAEGGHKSPVCSFSSLSLSPPNSARDLDDTSTSVLLSPCAATPTAEIPPVRPGDGDDANADADAEAGAGAGAHPVPADVSHSPRGGADGVAQAGPGASDGEPTDADPDAERAPVDTAGHDSASSAEPSATDGPAGAASTDGSSAGAGEAENDGSSAGADGADAGVGEPENDAPTCSLPSPPPPLPTEHDPSSPVLPLPSPPPTPPVPAPAPAGTQPGGPKRGARVAQPSSLRHTARAPSPGRGPEAPVIGTAARAARRRQAKSVKGRVAARRGAPRCYFHRTQSPAELRESLRALAAQRAAQTCPPPLSPSPLPSPLPSLPSEEPTRPAEADDVPSALLPPRPRTLSVAASLAFDDLDALCMRLGQLPLVDISHVTTFVLPPYAVLEVIGALLVALQRNHEPWREFLLSESFYAHLCSFPPQNLDAAGVAALSAVCTKRDPERFQKVFPAVALFLRWMQAVRRCWTLLFQGEEGDPDTETNPE